MMMGGGGCGAKKRQNLADPPFECYFTEVIPLITFDDFRDPPPPKSLFSK